MKVFNKITQSDAEPSRNNIWFKDKKLWFYNNNGWEALTYEVGKPADLTGYLKEEDIGNKVAGLKKVNNKPVLDDNYISGNGYINRNALGDLNSNSKAINVAYSSGVISVNLNCYSLGSVRPNPLQALLNLSSTQLYNNPVATLENLKDLFDMMLVRDNRVTFPFHLNHIFFNSNVETSTSAETSDPNPIYVKSPASGQYNLVTEVKYFNGSRDINPYAFNVVQEKGLYTVINDFRDTILGEDGKLKSGLIDLSPDKVPVKAGAGVTVSKSDSDITIDIKGYDKLAKVAVLNVGTTAEVKTHNQAQIPTDKTTFFVQIENGIGVAKFTTTGGSAVVTTGEGTRIKYNIGPGYSCSKDTEYFEVTDLVYIMPDVALNTLDSTTNMASLLTDEQADKMFKCSYIKFNLKKMSGEHVLGTLPITCSCSSLGFSEKVFQTPTLSIDNTDFTNIKITVKKMTPEGGTEEHWYAVLETV